MIDHLSQAHTEQLDGRLFSADRPFELKQDPGGIVDIEFIAQYLVLRHAQAHPGMTQWTDNVRIVETAETLGLLSSSDASLLKEAYIAYRSVGHHAALQAEKGTVPGDQFVELRQGVRRIWDQVMQP